MLRVDDFELVTPRTLDEAVRALAGDGAMAIAGGTDLVPRLKRGQARPRRVVALGRLEALGELRVVDGVLRVGAAVALHALERAPEAQPWRALVEAARTVATPTIRRRATVGGNLLQETRCRFFDRGEFWREAVDHCLKLEGDTCRVAPGGDRCHATFCSDVAAAALALGARAVLVGTDGERTVPLESLYRDDGAHPRALAGEVLVRIELAEPGRSTYRKLRPRAGFDFPEVGVGVALAPDGGRVRAGAVGVGSAPVVVEADATDDDAIAGALFAAARPLDTLAFSPGYRRKMVRVLARRAIDALRDDSTTG